MGEKIKIIVVDDNRNICQMLQNYLQGQEDLNIVGVAYNGLEATLMVVEDVSLLGAVTKELYPGIAKKDDTASTRVERGIRHAIELAWERGQTDALKQIFGYSMNIERQKPTNSEFIALLSDKFRVMSMVS